MPSLACRYGTVNRFTLEDVPSDAAIFLIQWTVTRRAPWAHHVRRDEIAKSSQPKVGQGEAPEQGSAEEERRHIF
jgi:hypothetical protein